VNRFLILTALTCVAAIGLAACSEREQVAEFKRGKYQGKPDTPPWDNAPLAYGSEKWTKGDRASWEAQIKTRQLGQHEYKRIYQQ
jgi:hypothetical protein